MKRIKHLGIAMVITTAFSIAWPVRAEKVGVIAPVSNPTQALSAQARLDFTLNVGKFLYFRLGNGSSFVGSSLTGARPGADPSVNTVQFTVAPSIPGGAASPSAGNNISGGWNRTAPTFSTSASGQVLGVELACNAGQVNLVAQATSPLSNGSDTLPASGITISSSSASLPAPTVLNTGVGSTAVVATGGTGTSTAPAFLTYQTANWTFAYTATATTATAGNYSGLLTFTASAP